MPYVTSLFFDKRKKQEEMSKSVKTSMLYKNNKSNEIKENTKMSLIILIIVDVTLYLITNYYSNWHADVHDKIMASGAFYNKPNFGHKYKYLTIIGDHLTPLFFLLSVFNHILHFPSFINIKNNPTKHRNFFNRFDINFALIFKKLSSKFELCMDCFNIFLTTMNSMIGILFWTIYYVKKELILPKKIERMYPLELNLFIHGITGLLMWCHNSICVHYKVHDFNCHRLIIFIFDVGYVLWIGICYNINGWWPYDFLNHMDYFQHFLFLFTSISACMFINEFVCYIVMYLHSQKLK